MTAAAIEPSRAAVGGSGGEPPPAAVGSRWARWKPLLYHRWLQLPLVLGIAGALVYDRYLLARDYLFKYTDEDQACMWYAAYDLLRGRIAEPAFYGQDYNTCLEGYLAAPLIAMGVKYSVACPLVSLILGLLPFLLMAWVAWRRGHSVMAAVSLLVPLLLPIRYGMMAGIPRGFQTGIAVAILPAILLLPPPLRRTRANADGAEPKLAVKKGAKGLTRSWPALRYFFAAALSVIAMQVGENCFILLVPVAVHAVLTSWREWKFWVFGLAGLIAAAPYPFYVYQFYTIQHPDYVIYLRGQQFQWGWTYFLTYFNQYVSPRFGSSITLSDLVPMSIPGRQAAVFTAIAFSALGALLLIRGRAAALAAGFAAAFITFVSFGYSRVYATTSSANTASFPYARMFLAIPVVFVWLLFFVNHKPWARFAGTPVSRWITRGALVGLLIAAVHVMNLKEKALPQEIRREVGASGAVVCPAIPVEQFYATARELKRVADANHADFVLVGGGDRQKHIAYALAPVTGIEAIYPVYWERRASLLIGESRAKHEAILFITYPNLPPGAEMAGGNKAVKLDADGNPVDDLPNLPASVKFAGTAPVSLPKGTNPALLTLASVTGSKKYVEGVDYGVEQSGGEVRLARKTGGTIPEGDTIRLSWKGIHSITIPPIYVLRTHGANAFTAGVDGVGSVYTPVKTKANPNPSARVLGNGR